MKAEQDVWDGAPGEHLTSLEVTDMVTDMSDLGDVCPNLAQCCEVSDAHPPLIEDGGPLEDLNFPGYRVSLLTGMGLWRFSGNRVSWVCVFVITMVFLGMCGGLLDLGGDALMIALFSKLGVAGGLTVQALSSALTLEAYKYMVIITARSLRRRRLWKNELLTYSVWGAAGVAVALNVLSILRQPSAQLSAMSTFVAIMSVPMHVNSSMMIALGVLNMYTVRRSVRMGVCNLVLHYSCAVLMHALYVFLCLMVGYIGSTIVIAINSVLVLIVQPLHFVIAYRNWRKRDETLPAAIALGTVPAASPTRKQTGFEDDFGNDGTPRVHLCVNRKIVEGVGNAAINAEGAVTSIITGRKSHSDSSGTPSSPLSDPTSMSSVEPATRM